MIRKRTYIAILLSLFCSAVPCHALSKYGVLDSNGKWVIPAQYQNIKYLGDGIYLATNFEKGSLMFPVGKAFLLDADGKPFHIGLTEGCGLNGPLLDTTAPAKNKSDILLVIKKDRHEGVCDISGKIVIPPQYDEIKSYSDGIFVVLTDDSKSTAFLDKNGLLLGKVPTSEFNFYWNGFHEGVVLGEASHRLYTGEPGGVLSSFTFFDPHGIPLNLPPLCGATEFSEGYSAVEVSDKERKPLYAAMMDKRGQILNNRKFKHVSEFRNGQACAAIEVDKRVLFGVIDRSGTFVIQPAYDQLKRNNDRSYIATTPEGDFLIDRHGELICKYPEKLQLNPSENTLHLCVLLERRPLPNGCYGIPAYADENGHVFYGNSKPRTDQMIPLYRATDSGCLVGLWRGNKWVAPPSLSCVEQLPNGRWIAIRESTKFDKNDWAMHLDRSALFHYLLREKNLICMSRSDLIDLLGKEREESDSLFYDLGGSVPCGHGAPGVQFEIQNGRVKRWRIQNDLSFSAPSDAGWFCENVILPNLSFDSKSAKLKR